MCDMAVWRQWRGGAARRALRQRAMQSDCSHRKTRPLAADTTAVHSDGGMVRGDAAVLENTAQEIRLVLNTPFIQDTIDSRSSRPRALFGFSSVRAPRSPTARAQQRAGLGWASLDFAPCQLRILRIRIRS
jgi:hypothetical protein